MEFHLNVSKNEQNKFKQLYITGLRTGSPLNSINTLELLNRIEQFRKVDLRTVSEEDLNNHLLLTVKDVSGRIMTLTMSDVLYRVRKLNPDLSNKPTTFDDVWYPKSHYVDKNNRANKEGEPVLYVSLDMTTPLFECEIKEGDRYALIRYRIRENRQITLFDFANETYPSGLNDIGKVNFKIIKDFFISEFCKPVGDGTEFLYRISNCICVNYLDIPDCGGYLYPSIAHFKKGYNIALKPTCADNCLLFDSVLICQREKYDAAKNEYEYHVLHKADRIKKNMLRYNS